MRWLQSGLALALNQKIDLSTTSRSLTWLFMLTLAHISVRTQKRFALTVWPQNIAPAVLDCGSPRTLFDPLNHKTAHLLAFQQIHPVFPRRKMIYRRR